MFRTTLLFFAGSVASLTAQTFPYSPNDWSNPEFVDRFLGSYGFETSREPKIDSDEAELFEQVALLAETDMNAAAALIAESLTPESSAAINYTLANIYLQLGRVDEAKGQYRDAIRKFPNFMRAYKNLGLALIQDGEYAEAQKVLVKAVELGDGSGNTYGLLGFCYLNTDRMDSALDAYRIASVLMPDSKDWKVGKAHALLQTGRYEDAAAAFEELIAIDPSNKQYYISRSNAYFYLNQYEEAAQHIEIVRRMGKAEGSALLQLGNLYLGMEVPRLAYGAFNESLTVADPINPDQALKILSTLLGRYYFDEAGAFLADIRNTFGNTLNDKQKYELLNLNAELQLALGEDDKAAEILEQVVQTDPTNGRALHLLGNYYWNIDDLEEAAYYFERAEAFDESRYKALIDHARMLVQQQEFKEALPLLRNAQSMNPRESVGDFIAAIEQVVDRMGL